MPPTKIVLEKNKSFFRRFFNMKVFFFCLLLDKISKYGINSLTSFEKDFLDSYKEGKEEESHKELIKREIESVFVDDTGLFRFDFDSLDNFGEEWQYHGVLYLPDLRLPNGKILKGELKGYISYYHEAGLTTPEFFYLTSNGKIYEVFDFCEGFEYELDSFLDYVVMEIENKRIKN